MAAGSVRGARGTSHLCSQTGLRSSISTASCCIGCFCSICGFLTLCNTSPGTRRLAFVVAAGAVSARGGGDGARGLAEQRRRAHHSTPASCRNPCLYLCRRSEGMEAGTSVLAGQARVPAAGGSDGLAGVPGNRPSCDDHVLVALRSPRGTAKPHRLTRPEVNAVACLSHVFYQHTKVLAKAARMIRMTRHRGCAGVAIPPATCERDSPPFQPTRGTACHPHASAAWSPPCKTSLNR